MPSLVPLGPGRPWPIVRKLTSIGADADNDVVLADDGDVASTHAHIRLEDGRFLLIALSRAMPVLVNGRKERKHVLEHGDEIRMGRTVFRFQLWDDSGTQDREPEPQPGSEMVAYRRLVEFSTRLAGREAVDALLEALMDEVVALTGADKGFLLTLDSGSPRVRTARNVNKESIATTLVQVSDSIISRVLQTREPLIVSDALNSTFNASISVMQLQLCSVMCVPLLFRGELLGLIYVGNDNVVNLFDPQMLDLLAIFAGQAALLLQHAMQVEALRKDNASLREQLAGERYGSVLFACDAMRAIVRNVERVAPTDINVLVLGETGTGKELIAREIHRRSRRKDRPFVAVNCGAIPEQLMESELFGHRRGAFTGAIDNKIGSFQAADGGTLFLDELGEMPPHLQVKLLRAIQERQITRVGDPKPVPVDIRIVAATSVDLEAAMKEGRFREDLYYRLNVVSIDLPPLRERDEDVVLLAKFLLERFAEEYGRPVQGLSRDAIIAIRKHAWPGNIRELENRLKKAIVLAEGPYLTPLDLDLDETVLAGRVLPLSEAKEAFQARYIDQVLALNGGNRTKTAHDLGVDPRTIFRHLEKKRGDDAT